MAGLRRALLGYLFLGIAGGSTAALASPPEQAPTTAGVAEPTPAASARLLYTEAMAAYRAERFIAAAQGFDAAHAAHPTPALRLNAARAWERAGEHARAAQRFESLRADPEAPEDLRASAEQGLMRSLRAAAGQPLSAPRSARAAEPALDRGGA